MGSAAIIALIDKELARLQNIRSVLLKKERAAVKNSKKPGSSTPAGKKRRLSAAGRERIAAAQRKRWAAVRKAKKQ